MTIEWILEKNFKENFSREAYGPSVKKVIPMNLIVKYFKENPNMKVFSSHNIRFPIPTDESINFLPFLFIREPTDRIFSEFSFIRRNYDKRPELLKTKNMTLKEFIQWKLDEKDRLVIDNQLQFISDKSLKAQHERFQSTITRIKNCSVIGIVDRFDESMVVAEEFLIQYFKKIDLSYLSQNVSFDRKGYLINKIKKGREQIGDELMEILIKKNSNDLKIYDFSNQELNNRIKNISNFESKLFDFKNRCEKLPSQKIIKPVKGKRFIYSPKKNIILERKIQKTKQNKS